MTVSASTTVENRFAGNRRLFVVLLLALLGAVAIGLAAVNEPFLGLAVLLGFVSLLALIKWPDAATIIVVFYIYTNVGPVLMNFHGVPAYISQGFPVLLIFPLIWYILLRREKLVITPVFHLLVLLLVVYILGAVFSTDIGWASRKLIDYVLEGVLLFFFLTNVIRTPLMLKRVVWTLLISGAFIGGLSLYQQVTGTFDNNYGGFAQVAGSFGTGEENLQGEVEQSRLMGSVGEQNRYAQNMLMLVPLGLFQLWIYRSTKMRVVAIILTGLIIIGGALAFSRGAAVGFVMMILIFVLFRYIKFYQFLLLVLGAALVLQMFPQYLVRLESLTVLSDAAAEDGPVTLAGADGAIRGRATDMLAALMIFKDHPFVGVGPDMVRHYTQDYSRDIGYRYLTNNPQAHSLFPGVAAESGLLGLICFVLILYIPLRDLVRARNRWQVRHPDWSYLATAFFQVLVSYMVTGLFLHMAYMRFFYLMIALAVVASRFEENNLAEVKTTEAVLVPGQ